MRKSDFIFKYRVRNWPAYNRALVRRGSLSFWVDEPAVQGWTGSEGSGPRGCRPRIYADTAIECALVVRAVFHLSLRSTQGFLESVVALMGVNLPVPDYTTVSRRQAGLQLDLRSSCGTRPRHVVIDSTGLKVFGAGEWYVRKHGMGRGRCRIWRKLHLCVDETSKEIVAVDLTNSAVHDSAHMPAVLERVVDEIRQVSGDSGTCYQAILERRDAAESRGERGVSVQGAVRTQARGARFREPASRSTCEMPRVESDDDAWIADIGDGAAGLIRPE
jgi:hypothetical protein